RARWPQVVDKLVEQAIEQCRAIDRGTSIDRAAVRRHAMALGTVAALTVLLIVFGPAYLRSGLSALLIWRSAEASTPYSIVVKPGSAKVPRGADQTVTAKLVGFTAPDAAVVMPPASNAAFE